MDARFIVVGLGLLVVLVILGMGVISMLKGGEFNEKYGNKLMIARVSAQGLLLVVFIVLFVVF